MKFSEKMLLIKQGATMADLKKMEEEEAAEIAASKEKEQNEQEEKESDSNAELNDDKKEILSALEAANLALTEAKSTIEKQKSDYEALNEKFLKFTNGQEQAEVKQYGGAEVFDELFNNHTKKEEK